MMNNHSACALQVTDGSLTVLSIAREDRGAYTCRATSPQGEAVHTTRLLVQGVRNNIFLKLLRCHLTLYWPTTWSVSQPPLPLFYEILKQISNEHKGQCDAESI